MSTWRKRGEKTITFVYYSQFFINKDLRFGKIENLLQILICEMSYGIRILAAIVSASILKMKGLDFIFSKLFIFVLILFSYSYKSVFLSIGYNGSQVYLVADVFSLPCPFTRMYENFCIVSVPLYRQLNIPAVMPSPFFCFVLRL